MTSNDRLRELGLFDARAPRYTSYPPANHFSSDVTPDVTAEWIKAVPAGARVSLYLHIPYCRRLCWFCACRTQGTATDRPLVPYLALLKKELARVDTLLRPDVELSQIHLGGGTPTLLPPHMITELGQAIADFRPWAKDAQFSVEIDPTEVDQDRIDALQAIGMTRASIGVQDFDADIQKTIGRIQSYELTKTVADMIRDRGIRSLNADILYGLPHQTNARIADSVQKLLTLSPDRVALYGYAHVPWMSRRQQMIPSEAIPTPQERLRLFETASQLFEWDGYQAIGIDHFARPEDGMAVAQRAGQLRRNFQGYTDDQAPVLVGLGASSISRFPQGYAQNASATSDYTKAVQAGAFATHRGHAFNGDDLLRARIIEALMCDFEVRTDELIRDFGATPAQIEALFAPAVTAFGGMLMQGPKGLTIRPEGRPLTRMIARAFDAYDQTKAQHSAAI